MSLRATSIGISLLKTASQASTAMQTGEQLARGLKGLVVGAADLGAGAARGVGAPELAGRAAGLGALGAGTYVGGKRVKRKADELKFRLMYGDPAQYY